MVIDSRVTAMLKRTSHTGIGPRLALGACVVMLAWTLGGAGTALASCNPGFTNDNLDWQVGATNGYAGGIGGVKADILVYSPYVSPTKVVFRGQTYPALATSWVMLKNAETCSWAQVGWDAPYSTEGQAMYDFVQFTRSDNQCDSFDSYTQQSTTVLTAGVARAYKVDYDPTTGNMDFYDGSNDLYTLDAWSHVPDKTEIHGEIWSRSTQMPGGSGASNHETFNNMQWWFPAGSSGSWNDFSGGADNPDHTRFGDNYNGSNSDSIWDKECTE